MDVHDGAPQRGSGCWPHGTASGRALAVWLFTVRIVISKLGAEALAAAGDDIRLVLPGVDQLLYQVEGHPGSTIVRGDAVLVGSPRSHIAAVLELNVIEFCLLVGGWIYGPLNKRFALTLGYCKNPASHPYTDFPHKTTTINILHGLFF